MLNQLDHIVFENRNTDYGAYPLRRFYHRRVIWAWIISSLLFVLIFGGILIYYTLEDETHINPGELLLTYEMMQYSNDIDLPQPPEEAQQQNETIIPKPDLSTPPVVVNQKDKPLPDPDKKKIDLKDSTAKTGDNLAVKGQGDGSDTGAIYIRVERIPEFPGGNTTALNKYLREKIVYPPLAKFKKIGGTVHVSFIIETNGKVNQVKVTKSVEQSIDNEAIRVVKNMPLWTPGKRHGQPVRVILTLPIRFIPS